MLIKQSGSPIPTLPIPVNKNMAHNDNKIWLSESNINKNVEVCKS